MSSFRDPQSMDGGIHSIYQDLVWDDIIRKLVYLRYMGSKQNIAKA